MPRKKDTYFKKAEEMGDRIRKLRREKGLTQSELAEKLNISCPQSISDFENGKTEPSLSQIIHMSDILDCDIDYLICRQNEPRKEIQVNSDYLGIGYNTGENLRLYKQTKEISNHNSNQKMFDFILSDMVLLDELLANLTLYMSDDYNIPLYEDYSSDSTTPTGNEITNEFVIGKKIKKDGKFTYDKIRVSAKDVLETHAMDEIKAVIKKYKKEYKKSHRK